MRLQNQQALRDGLEMLFGFGNEKFENLGWNFGILRKLFGKRRYLEMVRKLGSGLVVAGSRLSGQAEFLRSWRNWELPERQMRNAA